jgi:hypothetical protein
MTLAPRERRRLLREARLLDELLALVRSCDGPPPAAAVDAVLVRSPVRGVPAQRGRRS